MSVGPWALQDGQDFSELLERWLDGPTLEARLRVIFAMVGRKISSDDASVIWQKLLKHCNQSIDTDLSEQLIRQLIMLSPEYQIAANLYTSMMMARPRPPQVPRIVFMITSCFRYLDKARAVKADLEARGAHACIVVGEPSIRVSKEVDGIVRLPVPDSYEALTLKVLEGLTWARQTYGSISVAKVDDDMRFNGNFNPERLADAASSLQYAGQPWGGMCDRAWHLGKTSTPMPIYGRRLRGIFAYGPMYLMGPKAVDHLVRNWVMYPGEVEGSFYEDRAIGELLAEGGMPLKAYPIAMMGGVVDQTERFVPASTTKEIP